MDRGIFVAMTGAKQIMQAQAVNNHNLANVNTVGYRADGVDFTSEPIYGPGYATRANSVAGDSGVDFSSGVLTTTGRSMDVAVNGKGYITVMGADGTEAYTRAGDLQVTADGALTTATGMPVMSESGPIVLPPASTVTIGGDGTVSVVPLGLSAAAQSQVDRVIRWCLLGTRSGSFPLALTISVVEIAAVLSSVSSTSERLSARSPT